jgi:hypothetical protein
MVCHVFLCLTLHIPVCPPKLRIQHDPIEANGSASGGMRYNSGACAGEEPVDHPPMVPSSHVIPTAQVAEGFFRNPEHLHFLLHLGSGLYYLPKSTRLDVVLHHVSYPSLSRYSPS